MNRFVADRFVELSGFASSILTVGLVILIERLFHFSIFTLSLWLVVPAGAFLTGWAAASGYFFAARFVNQRPTKLLLVNMAVVSSSTFFLIYYVQYRALTIDGISVAQYVSFATFLKIVLTSAEYGLARVPDARFEVGAFGYVIALLQLGGFMFGGVATYLALRAKPFCENCRNYLARRVRIVRSFASGAAFQPFADQLYSATPPSREYLELLKEPHMVTDIKDGAVAVTVELFVCPSCESQMVLESPQVFRRDDWKDLSDYARRFHLPLGVSIERELDAARTGKPPAVGLEAPFALRELR